MDDANIEALKEKHPGVKLHLLCSEGGDEVVVRAPPRAEYKRWKAKMREGDVNALEELLLRCLIWPDPAAFAQKLDEKPALGDAFGNECLHLAGGGLGVEKKAL